MLENQAPTHGLGATLDSLQTPLTDFDEGDCNVSTPSKPLESYTTELITESTSISESDASMLNKTASTTSVIPVPPVGYCSKEMVGVE